MNQRINWYTILSRMNKIKSRFVVLVACTLIGIGILVISELLSPFFLNPRSQKAFVNVSGQNISVKGPKGTLTHVLPELITPKKEENSLVLARANDERAAKSLHGLSRTLVSNMITGVTAGYSKKIQIVGVGYKVAAKGKDPVSYTHLTLPTTSRV